MPADAARRVAVVLRGDRETRRTMRADASRLAPLFGALSDVGLTGELAVYGDEFADEVRAQLLDVDVALVWVDPIGGGEDRGLLDALLRDVAAHGVLVSAHPDVILKMATKQVLYDTRELGWGTDTQLYRNTEEFYEWFPARLAAGPRVLKQYRGNAGVGVHKIELLDDAPRNNARVRVQHACIREAHSEELVLSEFMAGCEKYFRYSNGDGRLIDQQFQPHIADGMIRCYLVKREVVGFARQYPTATDQGSPEQVFGLAGDKTMYPPDEPQFSTLRDRVERDWLPAMQGIVGVSDEELPILWDADFLFGPTSPSGDESYVLCEINASAVFPFPPHALTVLATATNAAVASLR